MHPPTTPQRSRLSTALSLSLLFVATFVASYAQSGNSFSGAAERAATVRSEGERISICSFNIQFLGQSVKRDNAALADLIEGYDIVAVQELVAFPSEDPAEKSASRRNAGLFFAEMRKRGFSWIISESKTGSAALGGNSSGSEFFVAFYKPATVSPALDLPRGFIATDLEKNPE